MFQSELVWLQSLALSDKASYRDAFLRKDSARATELIHESTVTAAVNLKKLCEQYSELYNTFQENFNYQIRLYDLKAEKNKKFMLFRKNCKVIFVIQTGKIQLSIEDVKQKILKKPTLIMELIASLGPYSDVFWINQFNERMSVELLIKTAFNSLIKHTTDI